MLLAIRSRSLRAGMTTLTSGRILRHLLQDIAAIAVIAEIAVVAVVDTAATMPTMAALQQQPAGMPGGGTGGGHGWPCGCGGPGW
jgi:hypothetical protein